MFGTIRALIFLGIAGASVFMYTYPTYQKTIAVGNEKKTYEQALLNSRQFEQARDSINARYQSFSSTDLERLRLLLPDTVDNVRLVIDIEKLASNSGLVFKKVTYDAKESIKAKSEISKDTKNTQTDSKNLNDAKNTQAQPVARQGAPVEDIKPYGIFNVNFTVVGPYEQFLDFLDKIEHSLRIVDVTSVSFSVQEDSKDKKNINTKTVYEYTVAVRTYWLKN